MILFESIIDGIRDIKDHFGRTMLQLVGIILGAGSIVATFSLSVAGKAASMEYYKISGGIQKIWVSNKPTGKVTLNAKALASQGLTVRDALAIKRDAKQIDLVSPVSSDTMTVSYRAVEKPRNVMGVAPEYSPMNDFHSDKGRFITDNDLSTAARVVVLGTERVVDNALLATALVINRDGTIAGFQDKVQLDPSEEATYSPGSGRRVFQTGPLTFGVAICHEGWRYPETVRWPVRHGAHIVFHPQFHEAEPGGYLASSFADPANSFHEKAALCRAAENTCFFATVNCASAGSPTTSAVVRPDGTLLSYQPYGKQGLLIADLDITEATGLLATRCKSA